MLNTACKLDISEVPKFELPSKKQRNNVFTVVSMFSGCGGMDLGFLGGFDFLGKRYNKNPFKIVWANDINAAACRSYKKNLDHDIKLGSVWDHLDSLPNTADVLIGGFPCQDISVNGKGLGIAGERSGLYRAMVEAVAITKPKIFIAENVKGLLMKHNKQSLETVIRDFKKLGYNITYDLYHAAEYGIPQSRERVLIVGTLPNISTYAPPQITHTPEKWIDAKTALSDLVGLEENPDFNHIWSKAKRSPDQGNRRLKADRVAYTIRAECHGNIQYHYDLDRRISMREAARIQSFPDDFIFDSKLRETERQIGNAVPPVLAWHVARQVKELLQN